MVWAELWASIRIWVIMSAVAIVLSSMTYFKGREDGSSACDARYDVANLKEISKERVSDVKRDRQKPVSADRASKLNWLRQYTSP